MKTLMKLVLALGFMTTITACNTIQGAGQDIEEAGERIEEAAD